jgi:hypothetical protein
MDKPDIISLVLNLYDVKKEAKEYLDYVISPNEKEQFEKAKKKIINEYFPAKGDGKARLSVAKEAISDFSKLKPSVELEAELLMFLVECGCQFTYEYGDISEQFYIGMENNFAKALAFMSKHDLLDRFTSKAKNCVKWSAPCGYGFADGIESLFDEYYSDDINDD